MALQNVKMFAVLFYVYSPNKSDFIRAKYQFLSFVNKQKDSDASSLDDVSKVKTRSLLSSHWLVSGKPLKYNMEMTYSAF